MSITIKKAELVGKMFLKYSFEDKSVDASKNVNVKEDSPIHEDLRNAFTKLIPHFCFVTEQISDEKLVADAINSHQDFFGKNEDDEPIVNEFTPFKVDCISISNKFGVEEVVLKGTRLLSNGEEISLSTPKVELGDTKYKFYSELINDVHNLTEEVLLYMQGKHAPSMQTSLFDEEEEEGKEQEGAFN